MIENLIKIIQEVVLPFGGLGIFFAEVIEEVIVPIPSAFILLSAGFIFLKGSLTISLFKTLIFKVVLPAALGLTVGSFVIYTLAYKLENFFITKFGRFVGVNQSDIDNISLKMKGNMYDNFFIIIARVFPIVPSVLLAVFCGLIKMPWKKYFTLTFIGAFFRSLFLVILGWQVGNVYIKYAGFISRIENTFFIVIILSIMVFFVYRKFFKKVV
jgi:membrane protein DedA with SNARE-associated domain